MFIETGDVFIETGDLHEQSLTHVEIGKTLLHAGLLNEALHALRVKARPVLEALGLSPDLVRCDRWIGACLLRRDGSDDCEEACHVLEAAGEAAARMGLSEASAISALLSSG